MLGKWKTMDEFVPPSITPFNHSDDKTKWYWVTFGGDAYLCYWNGYFVPVHGGFVVGSHPKYWMKLDVPTAPLPPIFDRSPKTTASADST